MDISYRKVLNMNMSHIHPIAQEGQLGKIEMKPPVSKPTNPFPRGKNIVNDDSINP